MCIGVIALYFTLKIPKTAQPTSQHAIQRIDVLGAIFLLLPVAAPIFTMNLGGQMIPWNHPVEIPLIYLTPIFVVLFYIIETRIAVSPIIFMRFIRMPAIMTVFAYCLPISFGLDHVRPPRSY